MRCARIWFHEPEVAADEKEFPRVRHIAYNALDPEKMLEFYNRVLALHELPESEVRRQKGVANRFGDDGLPTSLFIRSALEPRDTRLDLE